jgi:hypothetical protein
MSDRKLLSHEQILGLRPHPLDGQTIRLTIECKPGRLVNFGPDFEVCSDTAALIYDGAALLGWADDYGTVRHPDHELDPEVKERAEALIEAVSELWAAMIEASA